MFEKILKNKSSILKVTVFGLFLLLFLNYMTNFLHIIDMQWFKTWQNDSDSLIIGRGYIIKHFGFAHNYFLLPNSAGFRQGFFDVNNIYTYTSQFGLAGNILGLIINLPFGITMCHILLCSIFCGLICYIVKWIYEEFGVFSALGAFVMAFLSKWLIVSVRDIYWILFVFILPFVISIYFLKKEEKLGKSYLTIWSILNFCAVAFKSLSGFEGITVVLINSILPIFYYALKNKWEWKKFFKVFFIVGFSGLFAFLFAIVAHLIQLYFYFDHSWQEAIKLFNNDIARRTAATTFQGDLPSVYLTSLQVSKSKVLNLYLTTGKPIIFGIRMNLILTVFFASAAISIILNKIKPLSETRNKLYSFIAITTLSILSPVSWYVLASPHSYIHRSINYMFWSLPTLLLVGAFVVYVIVILFKTIASYFKRNVSL